jgi:hypothetical protein
MVALSMDKLALLYREQDRREEEAAAAQKATSVRARFLATGLATEAGHALARGENERAIALFREAIAATGPGGADLGELRGRLEAMVSAISGAGEGSQRPTRRKASPEPGKKRKRA